MDDKIGALARITELFTSRGYNVDSICSGEAENVGTHRLTLVTGGDDQRINHILKLLKNIVYIFEVTLLKPDDSVSLELMLIKVKMNSENRARIIQLANAYEASIIEMNGKSASFRVVGSASLLDGMTDVFREFEIIELSRTGEAAIHK
jgi:acetolactate synthase I/III small subunit